MQLLKEASPSALIEAPIVSNRFKSLYKTIRGIKDEAVADAFYTAEKFHLLKMINDSPALQQCTKLSLYGIFMDVAVMGLSFDPSMKHLYIVPYNINIGTKEKPIWEKRAALQISGYGELLLRQLQGQIKYADNPVLVFEGDEFTFGTRNNTTILEHVVSIPRKSDRIIACYIKITRHDDSVDYKVMTMEDVNNLRKFSKDPNSKAWTDGMPGMIATKTIKHAFKTYPKLRMGEFTQLQSEVIDTEHEVLPDINYGLGIDLPVPPVEAPPVETPTVSEQSNIQQPAAQQPAAVVTDEHLDF